MHTLIPLVKNDRLREINSYKQKEYSFRLGENRYIYSSNIKVIIDEKEYCFQIRDNQSELKFYISVDDACIYLTLSEIYDLLKRICNQIDIELVKSILMQEREKIVKLYYTGLEFDVMFFIDTIPTGKVLIPESNIEIDYEYLFLLISLIQDKSNYLWMLSNTYNNKYKNGILRLFTCLISTKNNEFLKRLGWSYDIINDKYYFMSEDEFKKIGNPIITKDVGGKDSKIKYYLTEEQYRDIMKIGNPSNFVNDGGSLK